MRSVTTFSLALVSAVGLAVGSAGTAGAAAQPQPVTPGQQQALDAGVQVAAKTGTATGVNPWLANPPPSAKPDYAAWAAKLKAGAVARAASPTTADAKSKAAARPLPAPLVHDEEEPAGTSGSNDALADAEPIAGFGTGSANPRVRVLGELPDLRPTPITRAPAPEDNGSIPLAASTGITGTGAITTTGVIGDGPHGSAGDGTNDFDFYSLTALAGQTIGVDTSGTATVVDTVVGVYSAAGVLLASDDDGGAGLASLLSYRVPAAGTYYVLVAGYSVNGPFPRDPNNSGSGGGLGREGAYTVGISATTVDRDVYGVQLAKGDVLGATLKGAGNRLTVYRPDGTQMVGGEETDASFLYPPSSPLPGGGNTAIAYVTEESGQYAVAVEGGSGSYDGTFEVYRPGGETGPRRAQTVFLDFDGQRVNTGIWGGPGVRTLSPFSAFIATWGLTRADEATLIARITDEVRENIQQDLVEKGLSDTISVDVVNSSTAKDTFGRPNVSRVIVGGTIAESGISTIGIAQYIDPGNYDHQDSAVVLLDVLSDPSGAASLNTYLKPQSDRIAFVSQAVGNVVAHEIGHLIGNYHTNNANAVTQLMDAGGASFDDLFGVGPDGIGGTADDTDVDYAEDTYSPPEGFTGLEDALNVAVWGFSGRS